MFLVKIKGKNTKLLKTNTFKLESMMVLKL